MKYSFAFVLWVGMVSCLYFEKTNLIPFNDCNVVYILEEDTPIYAQPSERAQIILKGNTLDPVSLISRTEMFNERGNFEEWYFIDSEIPPDLEKLEMEKTEEGWRVKTLKGWVLGRYLVGKNNFKPIQKIQEMIIIVNYPDWLDYYHIYPDGTFISEDSDDEEGKGHKGRVYRYKNIISLDFKEFFYYDKEGKLQGQFADDVEVITK